MASMKTLVTISIALVTASGCASPAQPVQNPNPPARSVAETDANAKHATEKQVPAGERIFRYDTFGDERFWTDTAHLNTVIQTEVSPKVAFSVGLKVDAAALPPGLIAAIRGGKVDLNSPATTVALLKLGAVVGVIANVDGHNNLRSVGISCALCHSTVNNSIAPGIGQRLDGWPNRDLNPGAIIALSPAIPAAQKTVYNS